MPSDAAADPTDGGRARRRLRYALLLGRSKGPLARRLLLGGGLLAGAGAAAAAGGGGAAHANGGGRVGEVQRSEEEWRAALSPEAYRVLRQAGTERRGSSALNGEKRRGTFVCAGCGAALFSSGAKFESGTGWPSFFEPLPGAVDEAADWSLPFMPRTEVRCARCKGHLGHSFDDGPPPTGLRYCMNGVAMAFAPSEGA
ncbi:MAG: methionine-R-sulfoxide reductase [Monoraphidium minutum]|nr:MAG: methionine-R-sulfoxide reductase [Monoraphidium minutum]